MFSREEIETIEAAIQREETPRSVSIAAMRFIQKQRGYVSDQSLADLAPMLGMSVSGLESVATFYSLIFRKPVGRHVILVCDSVSCWILGRERPLDHLRRRLGVDLGQTTADDLFTLLAIPCLGACDRAPAMLIDETLYGPLTPESIDEILSSYRELDR